MPSITKAALDEMQSVMHDQQRTLHAQQEQLERQAEREKNFNRILSKVMAAANGVTISEMPSIQMDSPNMGMTPGFPNGGAWTPGPGPSDPYGWGGAQIQPQEPSELARRAAENKELQDGLTTQQCRLAAVKAVVQMAIDHKA